MKEKIKSFCKTAVLFILNPRLLLCCGIAWMITNGWSYVLLGLGTWMESEWMIGIASAYLAFLWLPVSPEKIVTVAIAMTLLRFLFPNDKKTLGILKQAYASIKESISLKKQKRKEKKQQKAAQKQV